MNHSETSARTFVELAKQDPSEPGTDGMTWLGGDTGALYHMSHMSQLHVYARVHPCR